MTHKHHIIPKYASGTDSPENLVELSIEEHANEHRLLYEKYGKWQDKIAWLGLKGIISHEEAVRMSIVESAKKGALNSNKIQGKKRKHKPLRTDSKQFGNQNTAKLYKIICPNGDVIEIIGLSKWCRENNINMKAFHKAVVQRKAFHKGYKLWA